MNRFKVLLVDDSPQTLKALGGALRNHDYDIITAESGDMALEIFRTNAIDLIITDENMPGLSSTKLLAALKTLYPDVMKITLTGTSDIEILKKAINKGEIYRFFPKPWDDFELSIAVRQGLQKRFLEKENGKLRRVVNEQSKLLSELEKDFPGISEMRTTEDGSIIIEG
ncbi:MAG: response regulator [candidate division Zixibacteria bacterium]|nr:response regulator [candidate division Zixibacteria bacterium]